MTRPPTPVEIVAQIKFIFNQDRRERQQAGFKLGTFGLTRRVAEHFKMNIYTVVAIKERQRHKHVHAPTTMRQRTVPDERLEEIRQRRIKRGDISESFRPIVPTRLPMWGRRPTYREQLDGRPGRRNSQWLGSRK